MYISLLAKEKDSADTPPMRLLALKTINGEKKETVRYKWRRQKRRKRKKKNVKQQFDVGLTLCSLLLLCALVSFCKICFVSRHLPRFSLALSISIQSILEHLSYLRGKLTFGTVFLPVLKLLTTAGTRMNSFMPTPRLQISEPVPHNRVQLSTNVSFILAVDGR